MKSFLLPSAVLLMMSACATVPPPTDLLLAAEKAVQRANETRGEEPSPDELKSARIKLNAARDAVSRREMLAATRFAEEARLDADYANARLEAARAQFEVEAMKKGNEALQQQALRDSVNVAPIAIPMPIPPPEPEPEPDLALPLDAPPTSGN